MTTVECNDIMADEGACRLKEIFSLFFDISRRCRHRSSRRTLPSRSRYLHHRPALAYRHTIATFSATLKSRPQIT